MATAKSGNSGLLTLCVPQSRPSENYTVRALTALFPITFPFNILPASPKQIIHLTKMLNKNKFSLLLYLRSSDSPEEFPAE